MTRTLGPQPRTFAALGVAGLFCCFSGVVQAEWHAELRWLSDYIYRGYSKSQGGSVTQAHVDYYGQSGWFAGLDVSQVNFAYRARSDRSQIEIRPYAGVSTPLTANWRADWMVAGYLYDNKVFNADGNYAELYSTLHYQDWLSVGVSLAPDAYQRQIDVLNYELTVRHDILDNLQLSSGVGYYQIGALLRRDYAYWNAGLTWFALPHVAVDLRYVDSGLNRIENQFLFGVTLGY